MKIAAILMSLLFASSVFAAEGHEAAGAPAGEGTEMAAPADAAAHHGKKMHKKKKKKHKKGAHSEVEGETK